MSIVCEQWSWGDEVVKPQELHTEGLPANSASKEESRLYNFEQHETLKMILLTPQTRKGVKPSPALKHTSESWENNTQRSCPQGRKW